MPGLVGPHVKLCGVGVPEIVRRAGGKPGHRKLAAPLFTTLEKATPAPPNRNQALPTHLRSAGDRLGEPLPSKTEGGRAEAPASPASRPSGEARAAQARAAQRNRAPQPGAEAGAEDRTAEGSPALGRDWARWRSPANRLGKWSWPTPVPGAGGPGGRAAQAQEAENDLLDKRGTSEATERKKLGERHEAHLAVRNCIMQEEQPALRIRST